MNQNKKKQQKADNIKASVEEEQQRTNVIKLAVEKVQQNTEDSKVKVVKEKISEISQRKSEKSEDTNTTVEEEEEDEGTFKIHQNEEEEQDDTREEVIEELCVQRIINFTCPCGDPTHKANHIHKKINPTSSSNNNGNTAKVKTHNRDEKDILEDIESLIIKDEDI